MQPGGASATCTADPGCRCAPIRSLTGAGNWGWTEYFTRFFETYKGYGNADAVAVAAIVALDDEPDAGVPSQFGDPSQHVGCCRRARWRRRCPTTGTNDGGFEIAYFGSRYVEGRGRHGWRGGGVDLPGRLLGRAVVAGLRRVRSAPRVPAEPWPRRPA